MGEAKRREKLGLPPREIKSTKKDLEKFIDKIEQLNKILLLIEQSTDKKEELCKCSNHEEVIKLTKSWGFEIGKRWGEN